MIYPIHHIMQPSDIATWTALLELVRRNDLEALDIALASESSALALGWTEPEPGEGRTLLMLAYWWGHAAAANVLLRCGSQYQQVDAHGNHAGWYAARLGQGAIEERLASFIGASARKILLEEALDAAPAASSEASSEASESLNETSQADSQRRRTDL